jgi:hypothetical protein
VSETGNCHSLGTIFSLPESNEQFFIPTSKHTLYLASSQPTPADLSVLASSSSSSSSRGGVKDYTMTTATVDESNTKCCCCRCRCCLRTVTPVTTMFLLLLMTTVVCLPSSYAFVSQQQQQQQRFYHHHQQPQHPSLAGMINTIIQSQPKSSPSLSSSSSSCTTKLYYEMGKNINNNNDNDPHKKQTSSEGESEEDFQRRMAVVRSLQMSFYTTTTATEDGIPSLSSSTSTANNNNNNNSNEGYSPVVSTPPTSRLDAETGMIHRLPLWRAPWWEVPGRSNVLNVIDPIYTNMFESILYKPPPWCFGHLYLEGGSKNLRSPDVKYQLKTWSNMTIDDGIASSSSSSSATIGAVMHIKDYRRMADGRLLLLVHAMERFVVTDIHQHLPYSIVNAQLLPDAEEVDPHIDFYDGTLQEEDLQPARAMAIQESVQYHSYEYDQFHCLQIPVGPAVTIYDISHAAIAKVLPYCPFSKTLEPPSIAEVTESMTASTGTTTSPSRMSLSRKSERNDMNLNGTPQSSSLSSSTSLEYNLLRKHILQVPPADPEYMYYKQPNMTTDELEYQLWLAVNHFLIVTKKPVSPILLSLLPPQGRYHNNSDDDNGGTIHNNNTYWPDSFCLHKIASSIEEQTDRSHDYVPVSTMYPSHRRQKRLSFSAAYLLEKDSEAAQSLRATLLSIPSTKIRLRVVVEKFHQWQTQQEWGEFA